MRNFQLSLQFKFFLGIVLVVGPVLGLIFTWTGIRNEQHARDQILNQARMLASQIVLTRQWVSDCGGVLVKRDSKGAKDTFFRFSEKLVTAHGDFQRFTPSMVTKKLSRYSLKQNLYRFRLAGLNPINPENTPNTFDRQAIDQFVRYQTKEVYRFDTQAADPFFRYSVPLYVNAACLECHRDQGYVKGTVAGCLSIVFPMQATEDALAADAVKMAGAGAGLILLTTLTLFVMLRKIVIRPLKHLENMAGEISKGNLNAKAQLTTGDEIERLGMVLNKMGTKLARSRGVLEEKVAQATVDLSQANRELQALDTLKSDFMANMSHELRSPLTVIRGGVDYLTRTIKGADKRNYLSIIDKNLSRVIHLVSDIFDLTKIEADKVQWTFKPENLSNLLQEVIEILSPLADEKRINIIYNETGDIFAAIDLERIEQVLVNLIDNAIKFSREGGRVLVVVEESGTEATVSVHDQGVGIAPENLEVIFNKFHTLPSLGRSSKPAGTGLGLTICRKIVEAHGGRIWAESEPGRGSTFAFIIPKKR